MIEKFDKTDKTCNNIRLIDERLCLKDSYGVINTNLINLSSAYVNLLSYANKYNQLYNVFSANKDTWEQGAVNINGGKAKYNSYYTTVKNLSSVWTKEFSLIYPSVIELNDWNANDNNNDYKEEIKDWLTDNFPPLSFAENQAVYVYVNLYQVYTFTFNFSGSYYEKCDVTNIKPITVNCDGKNLGDLYHGCNHSSGKGKDKRHWCDNAYTNGSCQSYISIGTSSTAACKATGEKSLQLMHISNEYNDTYTAKCVMLKYKKIEDSDYWVFVS
jgi:hypothetical protein